MNSSDTILLSVDNLSKLYGEMEALKSVTFSLRDGEFLSVIGPSGSGKSTLLKIVAGVDGPSTGSVCLHDETASASHSPIVLVWQSLALFPHLNVAANVGFGLSVRGTPTLERLRRVEEVLQLVGLASLGGRRIHELSGGEQQRVALARALILNPRVLLLDEPFGALDAALRRQLQTEVRKLHRSMRLSVIMVTHDQREAIALSDRVAILNSGTIEQIGTPEEIIQQPLSGFVARFLANRNVLSGSIERIVGDVVHLSTRAGVLLGKKADWVQKELSVGMLAACTVEPHRVRVGVEGENRLRGTVELRSRMSFGETVEITVPDLGLVRCELTGEDSSPRPGEEIDLSWHTSDAVVLPEM